MKFNADYVVRENPREQGKIDYINEKILFSDKDYLDLKAVMDLQKFCVGYSAIVKRHLIRADEYGSAEFLNVIAIKKSNDAWIFICDSKEIYLEIAKEFMHAYRLEATITGEYLPEVRSGRILPERVNFTKSKCGEKKYNATRFFDEAVNDYDAKREFLKFLLKAGKNAAEKSADNEFSDCDRYCDRQLYDYECDCQVAGCAFDMPTII